MPDGTPFKNPDGYWSYQTWDDTEVRTGPRRNLAERNEQVEAIRSLTLETPSVVYAIQLPDGVIKIGCTADLVTRRNSYGMDAVILAFVPGDFADELAIHKALAAHRARGREWYNPVPAVLDVVNEMRDHFHLEPLPYEDAA